MHRPTPFKKLRRLKVELFLCQRALTTQGCVCVCVGSGEKL